MDLCNLSVIKSLMEEAGITFRKDFGQNFLTNKMIPENIADNCTDEKNSLIIEIGPGIGCLTKELALRYKKVVAVEIDKGLIPVLAKTLDEFDNITLGEILGILADFRGKTADAVIVFHRLYSFDKSWICYPNNVAQNPCYVKRSGAFCPEKRPIIC